MSDLSLTDPEEDGPVEPNMDDNAAQDDNSLAPNYQADNISHHDIPDRQPYLLASRFQGQLPPPNLFAAYEKVLPGLANRLVVQMEANGAHRRFMDKTTLLLRQGRSYLGLGAGLFIVLKFLDVSYKLIVAGHDAAGTILGSVDLVALAAVFVGVGQAYKTGKARNQQTALPEKKLPRQEDSTADTKDNGTTDASDK